MKVALDTGIAANEETGQVELLAANHEECGYAWAIPAGLQLRAEALLLQAAQTVKSRFLPSVMVAALDGCLRELDDVLDEFRDATRAKQSGEYSNDTLQTMVTGRPERGLEAIRLVTDKFGTELPRECGSLLAEIAGFLRQRIDRTNVDKLVSPFGELVERFRSALAGYCAENRNEESISDSIDQAKQLLNDALDRWQNLRDPEPTEDNNFVHPETGNYRAKETYQILQDLSNGVITTYPLRPDKEESQMDEQFTRLWETKCTTVAELHQWCEAAIEWLSGHLSNRTLTTSDAFNPHCHRIARRAWEHACQLCPPELADRLGPLPITPPTIRCGQALTNLKRLATWCAEHKVVSLDAFDTFLSHNTQDKRIVRELADALVARRLRPWLDERELVPGRPWQEALEEIIQTTKTAIVAFGPAGIGPWEEPEMRACLSEFVDRKLPVIPVLLPGAPELPEPPLFLKAFTWVDLRDGLNEEGLDRLVWGITGRKPASMPSPTGSTPHAPVTTQSDSGPLATWKEKLEYLQQQEAITADAAQKFALKKQIEAAKEKISELGGNPP